MFVFIGGNLLLLFLKEYEDILFSKFKIYFIICVSILYFIYGIGLKFLNMILFCVLYNIKLRNVIKICINNIIVWLFIYLFNLYF